MSEKKTIVSDKHKKAPQKKGCFCSELFDCNHRTKINVKRICFSYTIPILFIRYSSKSYNNRSSQEKNRRKKGRSKIKKNTIKSITDKKKKKGEQDEDRKPKNKHLIQIRQQKQHQKNCC